MAVSKAQCAAAILTLTVKPETSGPRRLASPDDGPLTHGEDAGPFPGSPRLQRFENLRGAGNGAEKRTRVQVAARARREVARAPSGGCSEQDRGGHADIETLDEPAHRNANALLSSRGEHGIDAAVLVAEHESNTGERGEVLRYELAVGMGKHQLEAASADGIDGSLGARVLTDIDPPLRAGSNPMMHGELVAGLQAVQMLDAKGIAGAHDGGAVVRIGELVEQHRDAAEPAGDNLREALPATIEHERLELLDHELGGPRDAPRCPKPDYIPTGSGLHVGRSLQQVLALLHPEKRGATENLDTPSGRGRALRAEWSLRTRLRRAARCLYYGIAPARRAKAPNDHTKPAFALLIRWAPRPAEQRAPGPQRQKARSGEYMASDNVHVFNDMNFDDEVLQSDETVLVDFTAAWCGPCKLLAPIVEEVAAATKGKVKVGKLDIDDAPITASKMGIRSVPTLIVFKDGKAAGQHLGLTTKAKILNLVGAQ